MDNDFSLENYFIENDFYCITDLIEDILNDDDVPLEVKLSLMDICESIILN